MASRFILAVSLASCALAIKNPLIPGWNPDPHVLRVNDTYYVAVSSFLSFPGVPIYQSQDLGNWELVSHALNAPEKVPIVGVRQDHGNATNSDQGIWAPSLSYINGRFYMTTMAMWGSDTVYRTFPRFFWVSSSDLQTWSEVIWAEPYGIDPDLWQDPNTGKNYLSVMGLDDNRERLWGISQCEVDLDTGKCGGTGTGHRVTIARSDTPMGPWRSSPTNPLLYNGADPDLTVGNTGHAMFSDTPDGRWFATFLARRWIGNDNPIGRECFFSPVEWREDGWPVMNYGEPILLSQEYDYGPTPAYPPAPWEDNFVGSQLGLSWYQLRTPYTQNFEVNPWGDGQSPCGSGGGGIVFNPNVFTLGERDTPAAVLHKQTSFNMTFSATLLPINGSLGRSQSIGISMYSSEYTHQDISIRGCVNTTSAIQCVRVDSSIQLPGPAGTPSSKEFPFPYDHVPAGVQLHVRAEPTRYRLGWSVNGESIAWVHQFRLRDLPVGFDGAMFALFASGNSLPWPLNAPQVGFCNVREEFFEEGLGDYR
ncbi:glycosyl hydrolase [Stachybotrys elegans]|uniref:Glycosyl hydrolase n=1 Tax=Stachybotrys elegans TaxID=80388 RepID=A0A8K0SXA7_9HYPO|nr:glycosyl hydrolase [Stachybotrys elegans]